MNVSQRLTVGQKPKLKPAMHVNWVTALEDCLEPGEQQLFTIMPVSRPHGLTARRFRVRLPVRLPLCVAFACSPCVSVFVCFHRVLLFSP